MVDFIIHLLLPPVVQKISFVSFILQFQLFQRSFPGCYNSPESSIKRLLVSRCAAISTEFKLADVLTAETAVVMKFLQRNMVPPAQYAKLCCRDHYSTSR